MSTSPEVQCSGATHPSDLRVACCYTAHPHRRCNPTHRQSPLITANHQSPNGSPVTGRERCLYRPDTAPEPGVTRAPPPRRRALTPLSLRKTTRAAHVRWLSPPATAAAATARRRPPPPPRRCAPARPARLAGRLNTQAVVVNLVCV